MSLLAKILIPTGFGIAIGSHVKSMKEESKPSLGGKIALFYPLIALPFGTLSEGILMKINNKIAGKEFLKLYSKDRFAMKNYMFNKKYMALDIGWNQVVYQLLLFQGMKLWHSSLTGSQFSLFGYLDDSARPKNIFDGENKANLEELGKWDAKNYKIREDFNQEEMM